MSELEDLWARIDVDTGEYRKDPIKFSDQPSQTQILSFPSDWSADGHLDLTKIDDGTRLIVHRTGGNIRLKIVPT